MSGWVKCPTCREELDKAHLRGFLPSEIIDASWACPLCTLSNPPTFLACDACGSPRPLVVSEGGFEALSLT